MEITSLERPMIKFLRISLKFFIAYIMNERERNFYTLWKHERKPILRVRVRLKDLNPKGPTQGSCPGS